MNIQVFKTPRWLVFSASLGMMLLGCVGVYIFNRPSSMAADHKETFTHFDVICIGFSLLGMAGFFLSVISGVWILITAVLATLRKKH